LSQKISFISCVNNFDIYRECVEYSLSKQTSGFDIELAPVDNVNSEFSCPAALNQGLEKTQGEIVVFCHQDVIFPFFWIDNLFSQIDIVNKLHKEWGVLGVFGIATNGSRAGHVVDLHGHLRFTPLPMKVQSLDELCLIIRRDGGLKFDETLGGFHFYGADLCLEAAEKGFTNFAIDACVKHIGHGKKDANFWESTRNLSDKWKSRNCSFPVVKTTCGVVKLKSGMKAQLRVVCVRLSSRLKHIVTRLCPSEAEKHVDLSTDINCIGQICQYYEYFRNDMAAAVPSSAKSVLSVGCGAGVTEAEFVKRGIKVVGVEINPEAAKIARQRGLTILEGDVSEIDVNINDELYDCIIYADILEHLPDPVAVLKRHVKYLRSGGIVYVSIPNFRHYSVFWELFAKGHIRYKDAGILDRTHLRITTRKMVLQWFEQAGLKLVRWKYINNRKKAKLISACFLWLAQEFTTVQIGVIGKKE